MLRLDVDLHELTESPVKFTERPTHTFHVPSEFVLISERLTTIRHGTGDLGDSIGIVISLVRILRTLSFKTSIAKATSKHYLRRLAAMRHFSTGRT